METDILIVGAGPVGLAAALALSGQGLRVTVMERAAAPERATGVRAITLSEGSRRILDGLGVWPRLASAATPVTRILTSQRGHFGAMRITAEEVGVAALGQVIVAEALPEAINAVLAERAAVTFLRPAEPVSLAQAGLTVTVGVATADAGGITVQAGLVIAADGAESAVRDLLGIPVARHDYGHAVVTQVEVERSEGEAYERFLPSGPLALLPMGARRYGVVWTNPETWLADDCDDTFLAALSLAFGRRLGRFLRVGARARHALFHLRAADIVRGRAVLVGNAAHVVHPVAGQGFNLGLRDVAWLAERIAARPEDTSAHAAFGEAISGYGAARAKDHRQVLDFTDRTIRLFSGDAPPLAFLRGLSLVALDHLPQARRFAARRLTGLEPPLPRLARGFSPCA